MKDLEQYMNGIKIWIKYKNYPVALVTYIVNLNLIYVIF